jgi:hypothetical protein
VAFEGRRGTAYAAAFHNWMETDYKVLFYAARKSVVVAYYFTYHICHGTPKQAIQGHDILFLVKELWMWLVAADQFPQEPPHAEPV